MAYDWLEAGPTRCDGVKDKEDAMKTASITIPPLVVLRTGFYLVFTAIRHPLTSVTFELKEE